MTTTTTNLYGDLLDQLAQGDIKTLEQLEPIDTPPAPSPSFPWTVFATGLSLGVAVVAIAGFIL